MSGGTAGGPLARQLLGRAALLLPYFEDASITDILLNGTHSLFVEREGRLEAEPPLFADKRELFDLIERLLVPLGKRIDAAHPYADGRAADGSRFHIILSPVAFEGPVISFRKSRHRGLAPLESFGSPSVMESILAQLASGNNLLIVGGTGSGKTTLLTRLLGRVPAEERIVVVEESLEILPEHPHVLHLEARPASPDGTGEVTLRALIRNALRMRPDRLILGECRGPEAFDLLQAMNTGHRGSLSTLHANSCLDALRRLEGLALLGAPGVPLRAVREWIGASIHGVIYLERDGGTRRVAERITVHGLEGEVYRITPKLRLGARFDGERWGASRDRNSEA